ncbi:MAG: hypothetical protein LQ343_004582 [Gyalolechia ehrenbergii]|nr:MAG: hypothetical protein LQ343_004582 [Gyalolechia ehrenbergii]
MAAAGGPASIITQVSPGGPSPPQGGNAFSDVGPDENINLDLRGTRFTLSRDELLTLPEFVLLSLFPNGLLPDGHMNSFHDGDTYPVDYDPASLQYMLDFFRTVAQTIPSSSPSPTTDTPSTDTNIPGSARDMLQDRAGIIVLREDLDFYAIPHKAEIDQSEMIEVKRAAGRALLKQDGIFSGLRKSEEAGTTEQHLIEMLTAGGFYNDDRWGHRASEPNKAVICSLALARLRTDIKGNDLANSNAVGMAQKLLLFWRKPARRCWWEGVELDNVEGVEGKLKVWIRRVWTLEMSASRNARIHTVQERDDKTFGDWPSWYHNLNAPTFSPGAVNELSRHGESNTLDGFALYRALLRRSRKVLPIEQAESFEKHTKSAFRTNAKAHGRAAICAALSTGYRALEDLATRKLSILRQLKESSHASRLESRCSKKTQEVPAPTNQVRGDRPRHQPCDARRRWPHPGAKLVLDGLPSPPPGKLRRVPTLVNASHIPFLRFKKPQSPFLSYMIRKKNVEREKRVDKLQALEKFLIFAEDEDQWDMILREHHRISGDKKVSWASAVRVSHMSVKQVHQANTLKRLRIAQRMFNILQEQKRLAERERLERRNRRHQAYKARKAQREAAIAAERFPTSEADAPADSATPA